MDTTDNTKSPKRRIEDQAQAATLNWDAPGAPAVPAAQPAPARIPLRAVASMCVKPDDISFFPTAAGKLLEPGHYMLSVQGAAISCTDASAVPAAGESKAQLQAAAPSDLQPLKALALAATPGKWISERAMIAAVHPRGNDADGTTALAHFTGYFDEQHANAEFVAAASPAVVLDLIARIGHLNEALKVANDCLAGRPVPAATKPTADLESIEQYLVQMAAISSAALGHWKESQGIRPEYDTVPLRDVAKLYAKYEALRNAATRPALLDYAHAEPQDDWKVYTDGMSVKTGALFDVVLTNGVTEYRRPVQLIDWTQVRDWRYSAPAGEVSQGAAPTAPAADEEFTITGNVCEIGRLDDENGEHGLVIKREFNFVTIKGLHISELQSLSRVAFDDVVISIRAAQPNIQEAGNA